MILLFSAFLLHETWFLSIFVSNLKEHKLLLENDKQRIN